MNLSARPGIRLPLCAAVYALQRRHDRTPNGNFDKAVAVTADRRLDEVEAG
jgi:hypothetical protein